MALETLLFTSITVILSLIILYLTWWQIPIGFAVSLLTGIGHPVIIAMPGIYFVWRFLINI